MFIRQKRQAKELNAFDRMFKQTVLRCQLWILYKLITAFFKIFNYKLLPANNTFSSTVNCDIEFIGIRFKTRYFQRRDWRAKKINMVKKSALRD